MPIYEYQCEKCGAHLEKRQAVSDEPLKVCEECGGELVKKVSLSGFQFKGAGWYVTDYAAKSGKSSEGKSEGSAEKTSGAESTTGPESASKSKSEAPAASKADSSANKD
ncbi:MAG: FmdB family zinc ribbon protein [Pyrinomonadaceae bacterium]